MSNTKKGAEVTEVTTPQTQEVQVQSNASVELVDVNNFDGLDIEALLEKSTSLNKLETIVSLSPESITLEKVGESFRGLFMGYGEMQVNDNATDEKRILTCVKFLIDKKMCINAGAVLVSECRNANLKIGTPLEVTYTEKRGNVKIYRITLLG